MWYQHGNFSERKDLLTLYTKFYNKFEEITQSCSDCPFEKQCSIYVNGRGSYICDDLEYLLEAMINYKVEIID